jgi:hypothetical protein
VIVLILMMLIIIPLLTVNDPDISLSLGVQFVHDLGMKSAVDAATYSVRFVFLCTLFIICSGQIDAYLRTLRISFRRA